MSETLTLPGDLTSEEARLACRLEDEAVAEARQRAALAIRVRREVLRLAALGHGIGTALSIVGDDEWFPVSEGVARDIWYQRRGWAMS